MATKVSLFSPNLAFDSISTIFKSHASLTTYKDTKPPSYFASPDGSFNRKPSTFRSTISPDANAEFPAEKDRYVLYIHIGCPWAHRANITRSLKGLEEIVQMVVFDASLIHQGSGWAMSGDKREPLYGFKTLRELYEKAQPGFEGRCTVPMLWDKKKGK